MARNSHNAAIDESAKPWSNKFKAGKNAHGQTWEDIFGTPEHPALTEETDSAKVHNGEHESLLHEADKVQGVWRSFGR